MSLHLPQRAPRKHRAQDRIRQLEATVADQSMRLQAADKLIRNVLREKSDTYLDLRNAEQARDCADALAETRLQQIRDLQRKVDELTRRLEVQCLAESAATRTQEIDLRELQARFTDGPVVTLHHSPQATSPAHVPSCAKPGPAEGAA